MRYDTSVHMSLNESIRQIGSREHAISIIENIINDIFHRADALLESEEFFIEFYADNKTKFSSMLNESIMTEDQFTNILYPLIVEGLWSKLMGEKLPTDEFKAKIDSIHDLANQAYRGSKEGNTELQGKAEEFRSRMVNKLKQQYMEKSKNQGGLRGFGRRLMDRLGGSSVFRALGAKPYTELELEGPYRNPETGLKLQQQEKERRISNAKESLRKRKTPIVNQEPLIDTSDETTSVSAKTPDYFDKETRDKLEKVTNANKKGRNIKGRMLPKGHAKSGQANKKSGRIIDQSSLF